MAFSAQTSYGPPSDRIQDATVYVGNLDQQVDEELLWEMFREAGPVVSAHLPKDRVTNEHQGFGFVEFKSEEDGDYAIKVMNMIKLFGKPVRVTKASTDRADLDTGANLFIGNLDPDVDEKMLFDTFSAFGVIPSAPKVMRNADTGASNGFGFVSFEDFNAADAAIEAMSGQYIMNRQITVNYALKNKDGSERYGGEGERMMESQRKKNMDAPLPTDAAKPNIHFSAGPGMPITGSTPSPAAAAAAAAAGIPPAPPAAPPLPTPAGGIPPTPIPPVPMPNMGNVPQLPAGGVPAFGMPMNNMPVPPMQAPMQMMGGMQMNMNQMPQMGMPQFPIPPFPGMGWQGGQQQRQQ